MEKNSRKVRDSLQSEAGVARRGVYKHLGWHDKHMESGSGSGKLENSISESHRDGKNATGACNLENWAGK
mgnify:CR=1 FL=1